MNEMILPYYLYLAAFLFSTGLFIAITKRNVIFVLIGIELILNGANLVLASFSAFDTHINGQIFAIFSVVLTVCEVSIALAILLNVFQYYKSSNLDELKEVGNE
jgi:NADH:ubiquinone oxidoreductase subunit K